MEKVRHPAVSGQFYPGEEAELKKTVEGYLAAAKISGRTPKAIIAPHAGYIYSGPVAGTAYALVAQAIKTIRRVVLLGPSHSVPFSGLALSSAHAFETPLGLVPLDGEAIQKVAAFPTVQYLDEAHAEEHSLEVQLPFLQVVLSSFTLVPLAVGHAKAEEIHEVLNQLWGGPETLMVVSSDLSHYLSYEKARAMDQETARAIEALAPEQLANRDACGAYGIRGLLLAARSHGLKVKTLDLRNSGDTAGTKDNVVGYGAFAFNEL